jgi:hypothetical protein
MIATLPVADAAYAAGQAIGWLGVFAAAGYGIWRSLRTQRRRS